MNNEYQVEYWETISFKSQIEYQQMMDKILNGISINNWSIIELNIDKWSIKCRQKNLKWKYYLLKDSITLA